MGGELEFAAFLPGGLQEAAARGFGDSDLAEIARCTSFPTKYANRTAAGKVRTHLRLFKTIFVDLNLFRSCDLDIQFYALGCSHLMISWAKDFDVRNWNYPTRAAMVSYHHRAREAEVEIGYLLEGKAQRGQQLDEQHTSQISMSIKMWIKTWCLWLSFTAA